MPFRPKAAMMSGLLIFTAGLGIARGQASGVSPRAPVAADEARKTVASPSPDFKVVIWYHRSDPLETFRHQVYDVRKGEYTAQVDEWLEKIRKEYPHYRAYVKEVSLKRGAEPGSPTDAVASAIVAELMAVAGPTRRIGVRLPDQFYVGSTPAYQSGAPARAARSVPLVPGGFGAPGSYAPPAYTFPNPFPYPRPHP